MPCIRPPHTSWHRTHRPWPSRATSRPPPFASIPATMRKRPAARSTLKKKDSEGRPEGIAQDGAQRAGVSHSGSGRHASPARRLLVGRMQKGGGGGYCRHPGPLRPPQSASRRFRSTANRRRLGINCRRQSINLRRLTVNRRRLTGPRHRRPQAGLCSAASVPRKQEGCTHPEAQQAPARRGIGGPGGVSPRRPPPHSHTLLWDHDKSREAAEESAILHSGAETYFRGLIVCEMTHRR